MIDFRGAAIRLTPEDETTAAQSMGCTVAVIRAVRDIESAGGGFLSDGRPKILYEASVFWKLTGCRHGHSNVSWPGWAPALYGAGGAHQYDRLAQAMRLDERAALESASWGMFQLLGMNYSELGYPSIYSFIEDIKPGEKNQLNSFVYFCRVNRLVEFLTSNPPNFAGFAKGYNGPGYTLTAYDIKLEAAWRRHLSDPAPAPFPLPRTDPDSYLGTLQRGSVGADVNKLQDQLRKLGYAVATDGDFGYETDWAVRDFQGSYGLPRDGIVGPRTRAAINAALTQERSDGFG